MDNHEGTQGQEANTPAKVVLEKWRQAYMKQKPASKHSERIRAAAWEKEIAKALVEAKLDPNPDKDVIQFLQMALDEVQAQD